MTTAAALALACPRCGRELPVQALQPVGTSCPSCETHVEAAAFPALFRPAPNSAYQPVVSGEAACFFHSHRVAVSSCSRCGRFLCALCRISWAGADICTACLEIASKPASANIQRPVNPYSQPAALASSRFHYDSLALAISTLPVLTWIFSLLTAPLALGFALFTWRRESSIVPRSKLRVVAAILFSLLTIAGWIVFWFYLARRGTHQIP